MSEERDYDVVIAKLPRKDKDGNDITSDKIGKGGRHRSDGTYSAAVYDIEVIDDKPAEQESLWYPVEPEDDVVRREDLPWWGQLACDLAEEVIPIIVEGLMDIAALRLQNFLESRKSKHKAKKAKGKGATEKIKAPVTKAEQLLEGQRIKEESACVNLPIDIEMAYQNYSENMTSEEAQKEFIDAFFHLLLFVKKIRRLSQANIIDMTGQIIDGQALVQYLCSSETINNINQLIENKPELLERWHTGVFADLFGHPLIVNGECIPVNGNEMKALLEAQAEKPGLVMPE